MGVAKRTRKFAQVKRLLSTRDARLKKNQQSTTPATPTTNRKNAADPVREIPQAPTSLFFQHNPSLRPPYQILIDTNFLNFSIQHHLDPFTSLLDALHAPCTPQITDCVMSELEKLGPRFRVALKIARDPRFERVKCWHEPGKGGYADDCIVGRVLVSRVYVVATNDVGLKRRLRKIPGVPILGCRRGGYAVERLPEAPEK